MRSRVALLTLAYLALAWDGVPTACAGAPNKALGVRIHPDNPRYQVKKARFRRLFNKLTVSRPSLAGKPPNSWICGHRHAHRAPGHHHLDYSSQDDQCVVLIHLH